MNNHLLQIDVSKSKYKTDDDLIKIIIRNDEVLQVNFSKLIIHSKFIRDKYKYSEAVKLIPAEINYLKMEMDISDESLKYFVYLIQDEKVNLPIENYKDIYELSVYFRFQALMDELDRISHEELFKDITFSSQVLLDYQRAPESCEATVTSRIEEFLSTRINECFTNAKFKELPVCTIFRIVEKSSKESVSQELLIDFIFESPKTRFVLFKFSELDKFSENKLREVIELIEKENYETRKMYLKFLPLSFSLMKKMINKSDEVLKENDRLKEEISEVKLENNRLKSEVEECKNEKNRGNDVSHSNKIEIKQHTKSIIVGGIDSSMQFGETRINKRSHSQPTICPPLNLNLPVDPSSILSFSVYECHSVLVTNDGSLKVAGFNDDGRISASLHKGIINHFTDFCIKDRRGSQLVAVSAVCTFCGTLYMMRKSDSNRKQLVFCDFQIKGGTPIFLDIGNHEPVSLFGGNSHAAAIGAEGEVIFINRYSVQNSPSSRIEAVSLPGGEKASSVACCCDSVFVLSSNGRVFESVIKNDGKGSILNFSAVSELTGKEIVHLSGTTSHCLAVSKEGRVFGRGSNVCGEIGLGRETYSTASFTEISSLFGLEIRAAYAGRWHSLFETREGKILSCGNNEFGQLLLSHNLIERVYSPTETTITSGAAFCIAGGNLSAVFMGDSPPPNTPNVGIDDYKKQAKNRPSQKS